ncbi:MAG: 2Fe-2S iron-sulfur cluster binding domain-containing protein [Actinomycetia bacterium]|nr:2Fe-2S iron-sulfur cluster binding domain-containing protein [Actinomycetes bacterium]
MATASADSSGPTGHVNLEINGTPVEVLDDGRSLLEVLRSAGHVEVKDGCSPQGQCGCCTVLVDGAPRVSCVTPVRRVKGKSIVTVEGLAEERRDLWAGAMCASGGSQCGFCTPGIICRLEAAAEKGADISDRAVVDKALLGHACRCTGWQTVHEAAIRVASTETTTEQRDLVAAAERARLEGGAVQTVSPNVALGHGGFADDCAPSHSLVALPQGDSWVVAESLSEARSLLGKVQGRRTTVPAEPPITLADGRWDVTLRTCWVEPAYLEPDAVFCEPGGEPVGPLTNGGAFGGKLDGQMRVDARRLADEHGKPVRLLFDREDVVRQGPKRPPLAIGVDTNMRGVLRVARTPGVDDLVSGLASGLAVQQVDLLGPPTSLSLRGAVRAEIEMVKAQISDDAEPTVLLTSGAWARASVDDNAVNVVVHAGAALDEIILRSYVIGAAHQALGFVRSESLAVDAEGEVQDLTIRSFGILRSVDTPKITVEIVPSESDPVAASVAAYCAVAAAAWRDARYPPVVPVSAHG